MSDIVFRELKQVSKREEELRRQAHRQWRTWKAGLEAKVPEKVHASLRGLFRRAFELIFEKGTGIIEKTYSKEELEKSFRVRDYSLDLDNGEDYRLLNLRTELSGLGALLASTAEGVGLGALGIGIPDIALFTGVILRGCYETALRCGFRYDTPEERYFILALLEGALQTGRDWDACSARVNTLLWAPHTPTDEEMKAQLQRTADAFALDMLAAKFIQGIPLVGAVGGLANPLYYRKILRYVRLKYRKRYLMGKGVRP